MRHGLAWSTGIHGLLLLCAMAALARVRSGTRESGAASAVLVLEPTRAVAESFQEPAPDTPELEVPVLPDEPTVVPIEVSPSEASFEPEPAFQEAPRSESIWSNLPPQRLARLERRPEPIAQAPTPPPQALPAAPAQPVPAAASAVAQAAGERRLVALETPAPVYPRASLRLAEVGTLLVAITLGLDGRVRDVQLLQSSGFERLDQAALATLRTWRFEPVLEDGRAVVHRFEHRVVFQID